MEKPHEGGKSSEKAVWMDRRMEEVEVKGRPRTTLPTVSTEQQAVQNREPAQTFRRKASHRTRNTIPQSCSP
jgi:hypothetical protein